VRMWRALLSVYRALLRVYMALLDVYRALLCVHEGFLSPNKELLKCIWDSFEFTLGFFECM